MLATKIRHWLFRHPGRRFPFVNPPLRVAAQGLDERLEDEVTTFAMVVVALVLALLIFAYCVIESVLKHGIQAGILPAVVWLVIIAICVSFGFKRVKTMRDLYLGLMAERLVGQTLEQTRAWHCVVFHDLVIDGNGSRFNIDHLVIGDRGIFVIETKGRSKPSKGETTIKFDGDRLVSADGQVTEEPLRQVAANVQWIRHRLFQLLREKPNPVCRLTDERQLPVKPVVVYPGWYVDFTEAKSRGSSTFVTNETLLPGCIQGCPPVLSEQETTELADVLDADLRKQRKYLVDNPARHRGCFFYL